MTISCVSDSRATTTLALLGVNIHAPTKSRHSHRSTAVYTNAFSRIVRQKRSTKPMLAHLFPCSPPLVIQPHCPRTWLKVAVIHSLNMHSNVQHTHPEWQSPSRGPTANPHNRAQVHATSFCLFFVARPTLRETSEQALEKVLHAYLMRSHVLLHTTHKHAVSMWLCVFAFACLLRMLCVWVYV